jgi:hypothetical protein
MHSASYTLIVRELFYVVNEHENTRRLSVSVKLMCMSSWSMILEHEEMQIRTALR